jgi:hypothetical protein
LINFVLFCFLAILWEVFWKGNILLQILFLNLNFFSNNCHNHIQYAMNGSLEFSIFIFVLPKKLAKYTY